MSYDANTQIRRHDAKSNDTLHNDTKCTLIFSIMTLSIAIKCTLVFSIMTLSIAIKCDVQQYNIQHNDIQHTVTQNCNEDVTFSILIISIITLSIAIKM